VLPPVNASASTNSNRYVSVYTIDGALYVTCASGSACCCGYSVPHVFSTPSLPSPYTSVHSDGFSVVASTPVSTMSQSKPYVIASPLKLLTPGVAVAAAPNTLFVRLMIPAAVDVTHATPRSPLLDLYATARSTTAAAAVVTATSAPYVAPLSVDSFILMPVPAASVYTTITRVLFAAHATCVPMPVLRLLHDVHGPAPGLLTRCCFTTPASIRTRVTLPSPATAMSCRAIGWLVPSTCAKSSRRIPAMLFSTTTSTCGSALALRCAARRSADSVRITTPLSCAAG
jgi:hypothetical protein